MKHFIFDLQRFAEDGQDAGANVPPDGNPAPEPAPAQEGDNAAGSILGGAGKDAAPKDAGTDGNTPEGAPSVYDFTSVVPEGMEYNQQAAEEFGAIARECNLSQEQASKLAAYGMKYMQTGVNAAMQQIAETQAKWGQDAKAQLGTDFDKTVAMAAVGINKLEQQIPGLRNMLNETGAGNRIEMITFMAAIGKMLGEDGGHGANFAGEGKSIYPNTNFGLYK